MPSENASGGNSIFIKGARVHNLKNIDVSIPRDKMVVVTGVSGSGKSSLAFDTLYAEGQRRYVESLSAYARQFLGRIDKPDVDFIHGIPPAIAIEQRVNSRNPRSTVGTSTEIYDYLKLLFARIGKTISPVSGMEVKRHRVTDVVDFISGSPAGTRWLLLSPFDCCTGNNLEYQLQVFTSQGITRLELNNTIIQIDDILSGANTTALLGARLVIDRVISDNSEDSLARFADSAATAFAIGKGHCILKNSETMEMKEFTDRFESDGMAFEEPSEHMFSFNNPMGACPVCEGYGKVIGIDEDLVVPNKALSVFDDAVVCWKGESMGKWKEKLIYAADKFNFPVYTAYSRLTDEQRELLWKGNRYFKGINDFFEHLEEKKYKIQYRVMLARYRGRTTCPECKGSRLKKEAFWVKINGVSLPELVNRPVSDLWVFFNELQLASKEEHIAGRLLQEIQSRLGFLNNVGLGYLSLNRLSSSLSGGESQRINLSTALGSSLVGSVYILDEPSIGLHSRDTQLLIGVLQNLRDLGNTLVVVEHDEDIMRAADHIIDIGPEAGRLGGRLVGQGSPDDLNKAAESLTGQYLSGKLAVPKPLSRRKWSNFIEIKGASENNLKHVDIKFPLNAFTVVSGVSGSGKSSLIGSILFPALQRKLAGSGDKPGRFDALEGDTHLLTGVEFVDQDPIGKSSRSNPVTYIKAYDEIRKLYSDQALSKTNGFTPGHFSFNVDGGRCEECLGDGTIKVEMQFMADVYLQCESCNGKRFKDDILEVKFQNKNIFDVLELTVDEAISFFSGRDNSTGKRIAQRLKPLQDVGLGYVKLGQSSSTLSGGESQRVKLASFLTRENSSESIFFIFDEPTTGLHFHDINKLLTSFNALVKKGHTILVIEHNMDVIKSADWVIDLGPEGGLNGGEVVFTGTPEQLVNCELSYTGQFLKERM